MIPPEEFRELGKFEAIAAYASLYQFLLRAAKVQLDIEERCDLVEQQYQENQELLAKARQHHKEVSKNLASARALIKKMSLIQRQNRQAELVFKTWRKSKK